MKNFGNFAQNETGGQELRLEGIIAEKSWLGDEVSGYTRFYIFESNSDNES